MPQKHIPAAVRADVHQCELLYGEFWRKPKILADVRAIEAIYGPTPIRRGRGDFRSYQEWMAEAIYQLPGVFLGADMGLGKTAATLYATVRLLNDGKVSKVLIVAPLAVAENTWPEEMAIWSFARGLSYTVITGDEDERIAALQFDGEIHIINRENIYWLQSYWGRHWPYDMLIYDEASRLKGGKKKTKPNKRADGSLGHKTFSEFGTLVRMRWAFKHIVLLSGTPAPNGLIDLWGPMYLIDKGKRLGDSMSAFTDRWFRYDMDRRKYLPYPGARNDIMGRLEGVFFSLKSEDYLQLPPLIVRDHKVRLPPAAMEKYRRLERDMVLEEFDLEAANSGVLTNKLLQLANGSLYLSDNSAKHIHDAKLDALESIMAETAGESVMVAYSYQFDMVAIKKRFPYVHIFGDGKNDVRDWNAGKFRMLLLHPASAGHGLNFQHGGHIAVWYGMTWSLELYLQFRKRLHRSGQQADAVILHRILAADTADYRVVKALDRKGVTQDDITDAVRVDVLRTQQAWKTAA